MKFVLLVCFLVAAPVCIMGHGMVMDPVNRASRWRVDSSAPADYNDNQQWCGSLGGLTANGGRCGLCGDNFADATPRAHELGGKFGQGVIVKSYQQGSTIPIQVRITANHKGYFQFRLCNIDKYGRESDQCFNDALLLTSSGSDRHIIESHLGDHDVTFRLPAGVACKHCVLQWTYVAANIWGTCADGTTALGCGPQENYRSCSDITIV